MQPINFTANYITTTKIIKNENGKQNKTDVAIVELDKNDKNDIKSLHRVASKWEEDKAYSYAYHIYHDATKGYEYKDTICEHYYALTRQEENFEKLNERDILGLMLFTETTNDYNQINWLQTEPLSNHYVRTNKAYKGIGQAMVDFVKETFFDKKITLSADKSALEFYKKQGFEHDENEHECFLYWELK